MKSLLSTFFIVATLPVFASNSVTDAEIDEVVVTVKRRVSNLDDVSMPVTLISGEDVRSGKLLTDALSGRSGAFLQQTTPGQGAVILRGLKGSAVLHLVDGIRLNNAIFRSAPTQYLSLVPTAGIERLEVLRGTPTSLYGSDAIGGVVQVVTHVPKFATDAVEFRANAAFDFDTAEDGRAVSAVLDAGNRYYAASVSGGYQSTGDRRVGGGEIVRPSAYDSREMRILLSATPDDEKSVVLDLQYVEQPNTPRTDELVPGYGQTEPSSSAFAFTPNSRAFARLQRTRNGGLLDMDWAMQVAWQRIVDDRTTRDFAAPDRIRESNSSDLLALTMSASQDVAEDTWIMGAEYYYDQVRSSRSSTNLQTQTGTRLPPRFPDRSTVRQAALYVTTDQRIADRHLLSIGLRYSDAGIELPGSSSNEAVTLDAGDFSGDVGWIYDLTAATQIIANIGFGFRAPNVFDLGTLGNRPGNRFNIPSTSLDSEHVVHGDFGLRLRTSRWSGQVVAFSLDYDDRITPVFTGTTTTDGRDIVQSVNAANSRIYGVEAELGIAISDAWTAHMLLNYVRGEQRLPGTGTEPADRIPPLNGRLHVARDAGSRWQFEGWINFAGSQDRLSARDVRDIRIDPAGTPGWTVAGIRAVYEHASDWQISGGIDNLFDTNYRHHGSGIDSTGRNFSLGFRKTWH